MGDAYYPYDFAKGHPNAEELPAAELQAVLGRLSCSRNDDGADNNTNLAVLREALQYGRDEGSRDFLRQLSSFLERQCRQDVLVPCGEEEGENETTTAAAAATANSFFVTEGVSHAVDLLAAVATQPGDLVLTERPTYYLVAGILRSHGLRIGALPMKAEAAAAVESNWDADEDADEALLGIDLDRLEQDLAAGLCRPRLVYVIPAHQNPSGHCLRAGDRRRLARLAAQYRFLVVADEVYHLLDWRRPVTKSANNRRRAARMVLWNNHPAPIDANQDSTLLLPQQQQQLFGCVSVSSFTKIFGPGVRCGWIEATTQSGIVAAVARNVGYIRSQGGVSPVMGAILTRALADGTIDRVLARLRQTYERRCNLLCDLLENAGCGEESESSGLRLVCRPVGGYFVWIRLSEKIGPEMNEFLEYCRENYGVNFMPGTRCDACSPDDDETTSSHHGKNALQPYVRLCFAYLNEESLRQGAEEFLSSYKSFIKSK